MRMRKLRRRATAYQRTRWRADLRCVPYLCLRCPPYQATSQRERLARGRMCAISVSEMSAISGDITVSNRRENAPFSGSDVRRNQYREHHMNASGISYEAGYRQWATFAIDVPGSLCTVLQLRDGLEWGLALYRQIAAWYRLQRETERNVVTWQNGARHQWRLCTHSRTSRAHTAYLWLVIVLLALLCGACRNPFSADADPYATVYITNTGTKYHRSDCQYLRQSKIAIVLHDAICQGYRPCSVCKPPVLSPADIDCSADHRKPNHHTREDRMAIAVIDWKSAEAPARGLRRTRRDRNLAQQL